MGTVFLSFCHRHEDFMLPAKPRLRLSAVLCLLLTLAAPPVIAAPLSGYVQAVAEAASGDATLAAFYRGRDYAPLWTDQESVERRAALMGALRQADAHGLPSTRYDAEAIAAAFRSAQGEREAGRLEVEVTRAFLAYARDLQSGALEPTEIMGAEIKRELPRRDLARLLADFAASDNPDAFLRALAPRSAAYARLLSEKQRLERLIGTQAWGPEVPATALEPGQSGPAVVALRDRLQRMGYLGRSLSASYDETIVAAVRRFQEAHGITPDGVAGRGTIAEINAGPAQRLRSVIVALERERWMNIEGGLGDRHIWVNLPDFTARIVDDGKTTFSTRTVVGERLLEKRSYEFSDQMEYMEVNPDWTVPRGILGRDYLPRMQANPNAASYLQLIDARGRVVSRDQVNFAAYTSRNFPYTLRQPPGAGNSLGRVKFMFPNPYAIYLHDTPHKELFSREVRDFSNGCIRLAEPFDFAYHLLERGMSEPKPYFDGLVASGRQTRVDIPVKVPVHLVYFTAYPDSTGTMQYRRDVYDRDARLFRALEAAGVVFPSVES